MLAEQGKLVFTLLVLMLVFGVSGRPPWETNIPTSASKTSQLRGRGKGMGKQGSKGLKESGLQGEPIQCYECEDVVSVEDLEACPKITARRGSQCYTELKIVNGKAALTLSTKKSRMCNKAPGGQAMWTGTITDVDPSRNTTLCKSCCPTSGCNDGSCPAIAPISTGVAELERAPCEDHAMCSLIQDRDSSGRIICSSDIIQDHCQKSCGVCVEADDQLEQQSTESLETPVLASQLETNKGIGENVCGKLIERFACDSSFVFKSCPKSCASKLKLTIPDSTTFKPMTHKPTAPEQTTPETTTFESTTPKPTTIELTTLKQTTFEPTTPEPTTSERTTTKPTTLELTTPKTTTLEPTTPEPTTLEPSEPKRNKGQPSAAEPATDEAATLELTTPSGTLDEGTCANVLKVFSCDAAWVVESCPHHCS